MWSIWYSRNIWAHGATGFDPSIVVKAFYETSLELELPSKNVIPKRGRPACTWHGPSNDTIDLNVGGAVNNQYNVVGSGG